MRLTEQMIQEMPVADIHVHVPGTISPDTAWKLGINNDLLMKVHAENGEYRWVGKTLDSRTGFEYYSHIFNVCEWDVEGYPVKPQYAIKPGSFKSFDHVMAVVQGHRFPPGGIQTEHDFQLVMRDYLASCVEQKIIYTELQQNIRLAYAIYKNELSLDKEEKRQKFYKLLKNVQMEFEEAGVTVKFLHCFNKTTFSPDDDISLRAAKGASMVEEAHFVFPGVFVGMQSAGHERDPAGWPIHLQKAYERIRGKGFGAEAHGGEGIGSAHMMDVISTLPITRLAHGFQAIEDQEVIDRVRERDITLVMCPEINLALGSPVYKKNGMPCPEALGGQPETITSLEDHPFFPLLREHKLKIALATDNPQLGGVPYKEMLRRMAGISPQSTIGNIKPLTAEEGVECTLNAIDSAFCSPETKGNFIKQVTSFTKKFGINAKHELLQGRFVEQVTARSENTQAPLRRSA